MSTSPSDHDMSDSSSSGTSYLKYSPYNSPSQQVPQLTTDLTELSCADNKRQFLKFATKPFLHIIEQPQNHFRFRYVSEMIGTHGCLLGKSYGTNKTKTHPTVELVNYQGHALIRCQLAQHNNPEEHPHKLLEDEQDRDVSQLVPEQGSYKVAFGGIGIIHTAKKDVPSLLFNKLKEKNRNPNLNLRDLQSRCETMAKTINLNIVRLKFSAHDIQTGEEICDPVFSEPIHNMKSAATNDLKICRISRSSGSASGGEDVFILVEKVNKKNIMVRFFELNENGERGWTDIGQFMQTDVHHQYAIVFRTPPYKNSKTPVDVQVYVELVRPSDGRTSEPKEFKYKAEQAYKQIKKRKANSSYCSIGSSSSGSLKSGCDIPISVVNQPDNLEHDIAAVPTPFSMFPINQMTFASSPNQCDLGSALACSESSQSPMTSPMWGQGPSALPVCEPPIAPLHINSGDFELNGDMNIVEPDNRMLSEGMKQFFSVYLKSYNEELPEDKALESLDFRPSNIVADSARTTYIKKETPDPDMPRFQGPRKSEPQSPVKSSENIKTEYNAFYKAEDGIEVKKLVTDLCEMIRNKKGYKKQEHEIKSRLERLFNIRLSNGDTFLHMTMFSSPPTLECIVKVIHNVKATHLLDCANDRLQTTLHLAVLNDMPKIVSLLVAKGANPMLKDVEDLNAIHYAVKYKSCLEPLLDAIKKNKVPCNLDDCNSEKQSALHMSVVRGSERSARLLLQHGASHRVRDDQGRTPLHLAAYDDRLAVTNTLLEFIPLVSTEKQSALHMSVVRGSERSARLLLQHGASHRVRDDQGRTPLHLAAYDDRLAVTNTLLEFIPLVSTEKQSALHMSVVRGSERSARLLLQHGASHRVRDDQGRTPLHLAAYDDRLAVTNTLLEFIPLSEIDVIDDSGNTALQIVCGGQIRENTIAIARLLLEKRANPMKKENCNESAWRLVRNKPELKTLLCDYVAAVIMDEDDIKSEPEDDFESADEGEFSEMGLQELNRYARELSVLLDAAGAWRPLATRLRLDALLDWYATQPSPSLTLLNHLKDSRDDITSKSLALILEDMGHSHAASVIRKYIE